MHICKLYALNILPSECRKMHLIFVYILHKFPNSLRHSITSGKTEMDCLSYKYIHTPNIR